MAAAIAPGVLIWGTYPAMRAGIRTLLAEVGIEAAEALPGSGPSQGAAVVIADAGEAPITDVVEELLAQFGEEATLVLLGGDADSLAGALTGRIAPAGLLLRDATGAELAAAVNAVANGLSVIAPEVVAAIGRPAPVRGAELEPLEERLTERELDVLAQLALGLPNKAIALRLGISEHTVKYHVGEILGKLGAASRTEAVMQAARRGLLAL